MMKRILVAGVAAFAVASLMAASPASAQIKIAAAGPMTGDNAAFGAQLKIGAEQAVADLNAKGGVLGQKLVLSIGDDACDPKQAVSVANKLAAEGVKFVAGHFCSSSSIPASKVYTEEGILQITPASTNPKFTASAVVMTNRVPSPVRSSPRNSRAIRLPCCTTTRPTAKAWPMRPRSR